MPSRKNVESTAPGGVISSNDVDRLASDLLSSSEVSELLGGVFVSCTGSGFCFFSALIDK